MAVTIEVDKETVVALLERVSRLEQRVTELENQGKDQKATTGAAQKHQPYHPGTPEHDDAGGYAPIFYGCWRLRPNKEVLFYGFA